MWLRLYIARAATLGRTSAQGLESAAGLTHPTSTAITAGRRYTFSGSLMLSAQSCHLKPADTTSKDPHPFLKC